MEKIVIKPTTLDNFFALCNIEESPLARLLLLLPECIPSDYEQFVEEYIQYVDIPDKLEIRDCTELNILLSPLWSSNEHRLACCAYFICAYHPVLDVINDHIFKEFIKHSRDVVTLQTIPSSVDSYIKFAREQYLRLKSKQVTTQTKDLIRVSSFPSRNKLSASMLDCYRILVSDVILNRRLYIELDSMIDEKSSVIKELAKLSADYEKSCNTITLLQSDISKLRNTTRDNEELKLKQELTTVRTYITTLEQKVNRANKQVKVLEAENQNLLRYKEWAQFFEEEVEIESPETKELADYQRVVSLVAGRRIVLMGGFRALRERLEALLSLYDLEVKNVDLNLASTSVKLYSYDIILFSIYAIGHRSYYKYENIAKGLKCPFIRLVTHKPELCLQQMLRNLER